MAHTNLPMFWRLKLERMGMDAKAIQRRHGMEMMMGGGQAGAVLAEIMGPDEEIAKPIVPAQEVLVCEPCAMQPNMLIEFFREE
jgi:hypothetical protein